jgi:uncharacterized membrane protein YsdA (DUF1294 family)
MQLLVEPALIVVLSYILLLNIISFMAMWWDKRKARKGEWRVAEVTLLLLALVGGAIGLVSAIYRSRHKTQKRVFQGVSLIGVFTSIAIYWCLSQWLLLVL